MDHPLEQEVVLVTIHLSAVRCRYGDTEVIRGVDGIIPHGVHALIGPNGSGKTTLLKCIAGLLPYSGEIRYNEKNAGEDLLMKKENLVSYLPQFISPHVALTAYEVVLLGRLGSLKWRVGKTDEELVRSIFRELGITHLQDRLINELSGGQRQMIFLAQAMIKTPRLLLLDEPTNSLDLQYQLELFDLISGYAAKHQATIIVSLHDINMACRFADHVTVLHDGRIITSGSPEETIDCRLISEVYQVEAEILSDSQKNPHIIPCKVIRNARGEINSGEEHG